jgi:beta-N-acetylhexosaminidase
MTSPGPIPTQEALRAAPFHLDDIALAWVSECKASLKGAARLAQLFNVMLKPDDAGHVAMLRRMQPGAITQFTMGGLEASRAAALEVQGGAEVPVLVSGDVEGGAICLDGTTPMPNQLGMAALRDEKDHARALAVMMEEARAIGIDWTFSPVIDVNAEFRSAIVGTRSYGDSLPRIARLGAMHIETVQTAGLAATCKHWPGEGYDARDQHLLTTVNPLSLGEWESVFGALYAQAIRAGVMTIMAGHIAWPAFARSAGAQGLEAYRPASISRALNIDLLRGRLGFNGLIVSDATEMGGLTSWSPREVHLPEIIENGCDMILFSQDLEADVRRLAQALETGALSEHRVDEALTRILGLKAALRLHQRKPTCDIEQDVRGRLRSPGAQAISRHVASESITLVKDVKHVLPLRLDRHRRITVVSQTADSDLTPFPALDLQIPALLRARGFEIRAYDAEDPPCLENTDLMLYLIAHESLMTCGVIHFDWRRLHGPMWHAMRRYWHELPTVLVSMGHPYYLNEAPRMPCVINAYSAIEPVQQALVRKLLGEEEFVGLHPVDAFCGHEDAHH